MNRIIALILITISVLLGAISCNEVDNHSTKAKSTTAKQNPMEQKLGKYVKVRLTSDLSHLSPDQREMLIILIEAAKFMDAIFWQESYGDTTQLFKSIDDPFIEQFVRINYGPWDRLDGNKPFVKGIGPKPLGANFYPKDMSKQEFEDCPLPDKKSLYTILRRDEYGNLATIPYHDHYAIPTRLAAALLREAAKKATSKNFQFYLNKRAYALENDDYQSSDFAWLDSKDNLIDIVIGPIETYEDQLFGYKASHEAYVLLKDTSWSNKLKRFARYLPELQEGLPVSDKYKQEKPGTDVELNAYDVVFYAGDCNAGSKTIAINLPNDEEVQLKKGTRRLQLKNVMRYKFDSILIPIAQVLLDPAQRRYINFDAFFANTMFHEVAHGLGIKNTINGKGTVRESLKELSSALEEGKADLLGLYMVKQLHDKGELKGDIKGYYTTFIASIFRSIRFGASSAHGKANMIRFNYFQDNGVIVFDQQQQFYHINFDAFEKVMQSLSNIILTIQGDGDYSRCKTLVEEKGVIHPQLQAQLDRLNTLGIPVDIIFEQGPEVLGLR